MKTLNQAQSQLEGDIPKFCKKAHKLFTEHGWTWHGSVPTVEDIEATAYNLSFKAMREIGKINSNQCSCISTGRLQCRYANYGRGWVAVLELVSVHTSM